jgi:hypothetical protein
MVAGYELESSILLPFTVIGGRADVFLNGWK